MAKEIKHGIEAVSYTHLYKYYSLNKQKNELTQQISEEKLKSKELNEELNNSDSKSYIEYLAKKYLGLIYPNEKVYVTNEKDKK